MIRAFATAIFALTLTVPQALADGGTFDITVKADTTKANGSPWDGVPGLGNSKLNLNAAPDIAVCVVKANAKPECIWRPEGRRLLSLCQNAWTCKFPGVALQPLPLGIVLIDIDARNHDIIDTLIFTGNNGPDANAEIAASLRAAMTFLTPNRSEDSKEHAVKNAKIIPLGDCDSGKPCRLMQSEIRLERAK